MNEREKMKKVFLAFALWLGFNGAAFAMQDTEPSEAQGQNSAGIKILSDGFFKLSAREYANAIGRCVTFHIYDYCDKIYSLEISRLIKECGFGDGKYSACQNLLNIADRSCFEKDQIENSLACGLSSEILFRTNRPSIGLKRLIRACEVGKIEDFCLLCAGAHFYYDLDIEEVIKYMTMTRDLAYDKEHFNKIIKKLEDCKADKECNPAKLEFQ